MKRGFILGVVVLSMILLGVFVFGYHRVVSQQNIVAHHEHLGTVAGMIAESGAALVIEHLSADNDPVLSALFPGFKDKTLPQVPYTETSQANSSVEAALVADINAFIAQMPELKPPLPVCKKVSVSLDNVFPINPEQTDEQLEKGRDPKEKYGDVNVECLVEYQGLSRKATLKRQFRVVSMVPGPFARFTLFVPDTPFMDSYNGMGVKFGGGLDPNYSHDCPSGNPVKIGGPLKLINGTEPWNQNDGEHRAEDDLSKRGWVFLGPSRDLKYVSLRIPGGYDSNSGGGFMFHLPPGKNQSGQDIVPLEEITGSIFCLTPRGNNCRIRGQFQGFWTQAPNENIWKNLPKGVPASRAAASWLFPFGDKSEPSRTLMVGPAMAGFLKVHCLIDPPPSFSWSFFIRYWDKQNPTSGPSYYPTLGIPEGSAAGQEKFKLEEVFLAVNGDQGAVAYSTLLPPEFFPVDNNGTVEGGVPFNVIFEFMRYPANQGWTYPDPKSGSPVLENLGPYHVPSITKATNAGSGALRGMQSHEAFQILFTENGGAGFDNTFFRGDLSKYQLDPESLGNLAGRITDVIDLTGCQNPTDEKQMFHDHLFLKNNQTASLKRSGIYLVLRADNKAGTQLHFPTEDLTLDRDIIIIVSQGDILLPGKIKANMVDSAPDKLCTIVALNGNIYLGTDDEIHAYLVAINPKIDNNIGGRLLCSNQSREMKIFGGLAIRTMGVFKAGGDRTTMGDFFKGGKLRFNPRFNPSSPVYPDSRKFIADEKNVVLVIRGGVE